MLAWQKDFASQAASIFKKNGRILLVIGFVLIVDITLLGLFIEWAYVQHYGITSSIFFANALFSTQDHSLIESFGYLKEAAICLLLASLFLRTRVLLHLAFSTFFLVLLLDDFFSVHEQMGKVFAPVLGPSLARYGELAGEVLFGALPLALIGFAWLRADLMNRYRGALLGLGVGVLLFFGMGVDLLHDLSMYRAPGASGQTLASFLEDGGELLALTLILFITLGITGVFATPAGETGPAGLRTSPPQHR